MKRVIVIGAVFAIAALAATLPLAAEVLVWPWKDKTPPDPALVVLTSVESVSAAINKSEPPTVTINVGATAATPGFTELQLGPRIGNPEDLVFAFDAKGRPPQTPRKSVRRHRNSRGRWSGHGVRAAAFPISGDAFLGTVLWRRKRRQ